MLWIRSKGWAAPRCPSQGRSQASNLALNLTGISSTAQALTPFSLGSHRMTWLLTIQNYTNVQCMTTTPSWAAMEKAIAVSTWSSTPHPSMPWGWREEKTPEVTWNSESKMQAATSSLYPTMSALSLIPEHLPVSRANLVSFSFILSGPWGL